MVKNFRLKTLPPVPKYTIYEFCFPNKVGIRDLGLQDQLRIFDNKDKPTLKKRALEIN